MASFALQQPSVNLRSIPCLNKTSSVSPFHQKYHIRVSSLNCGEFAGKLIIRSSQSVTKPNAAAAEETTAIPSEYTEVSKLNSDQIIVGEKLEHGVRTDNDDNDQIILGEKLEHEVRTDNDDNSGPEYLSGNRMIKVCDKLIEVFMVDKPTTTDWRRLLAFSGEWENIRPHFFERCQERADAESDPGMKHKLLRFGRKLKEIDDDVQRHTELLKVIKESPTDISAIVARRRKDFTEDFFVHLHTVAESYFEHPDKQNDLARLGNVCLAAVQAYDTATESIEALNAAELKFQDIINSPSLSEACRKIDNLAEKNQLDSALMLMISKAWSTAKESNMMKDEVKDILYHLYKTSVGNLQRLMPKEIRILKYLLTIEDPEELNCGLKDAFTPGQELEGKDVDCLYTSPQELHKWIKTVVDAYNFSREGTLVREARELMNPKVMPRLENIMKLIETNYL